MLRCVEFRNTNADRGKAVKTFFGIRHSQGRLAFTVPSLSSISDRIVLRSRSSLGHAEGKSEPVRHYSPLNRILEIVTNCGNPGVTRIFCASKISLENEAVSVIIPSKNLLFSSLI